jgi:predicted nucleic acid-binding protein
MVVDGAQELASSALLAAEIRRVVGLVAATSKLTPAAARELTARAEQVIGQMVLVEVDEDVVAAAGRLQPPELRTMDALHVATAALLAGDLDALVSYDRRMLDAGRLAGLPTLSPT